MSSKYLGIDQRFTSSGLVVIDESGQMVHYQIASSNPKESHFKRAWDILKVIEQVVVEQKVTHISIEGLAFGGHGNVTRSLAILQGIIVANLQFSPPTGHSIIGPQIAIVTPTTLKLSATGGGRADKKQMKACLPEEIRDKIKKMSSKIDDLTDAYFLAQYIYINGIPSVKPIDSSTSCKKTRTSKSTKSKKATKLLPKPKSTKTIGAIRPKLMLRRRPILEFGNSSY